MKEFNQIKALYEKIKTVGGQKEEELKEEIGRVIWNNWSQIIVECPEILNSKAGQTINKMISQPPLPNVGSPNDVDFQFDLFVLFKNIINNKID